MEKHLIPQLRFPCYKDNWHKVVLDDITTKISDGIHSTPKYDINGDYYFVNGNNLVDGIITVYENTKKVSLEEFKKHKRPLNNNSILLSINGTIGNLAFYNNEKIVLGKSACYINFQEDLPISFYYYILQSPRIKKYFLSELTGSTIMNLSLRTIKTTRLIVPSSPEQQKIASFLTDVDAKITQLTKKKSLLEQYKKGIMQKIFNQEFRFKDDSDNAFPEWEERKLADFENLIHGDGDWILSKDISAKGDYEIVQLGNIGFGLYVEKKLKTITSDKFEELNGTLVNKGDLLINRMVDGALNCCILKKNGNYITSVDVCWIRQNDYFNNYFFMSLILFSKNQNKLLNLSSGSGRVRISKKNLFNEFSFMLPSIEEQTKIANFLSDIDIKIEALSTKIENTQTFKKGLLQKMFV